MEALKKAAVNMSGGHAKLAAATKEDGKSLKPELQAERRLSRLISSDRTSNGGDQLHPADMMGKRNSLMITTGSQRTSISAGSSKHASGGTASILGIMASRRFAKKLAGRAAEKRESTVNESLPHVNYEPTYRMAPKAKFNPTPVKEILKEVIEGRLKDMKYNPRIAPNMNKILSDEVKDRVKKLGLERYKFIVMVLLGERKGQGVLVTSRCAWDDKLDSHVTHTFTNKTVFCSASVYAVYQE